MGRRYFVTGGAGFIGSNFVRLVLAREPDARVTNFDLLTYAGVRATVEDLNREGRHTFVRGDIRDARLVNEVLAGHDVVVNFAAESHVDRSILAPAPFLETNVVGTGVLLEAARRHGVERFVHMGTDEVYGSIEAGAAVEDSPLRPSSPYSASKAGADLLCLSFATTYGYRPIIARSTNSFGPYQFPEKVIPLFITNLLDGLPVPLYGDGRNERDWLYVEDLCACLHLLVESGEAGEVYNVAADAHLSNIDLARTLASALGRDESLIQSVPDRPGHDLRYALDSRKIRALGWSPRYSFGDRIGETIDWYRRHEFWWRPLKESAR